MSSNAPTVIKIGGALLDQPALLPAFWQSVKQLRAERPVVIVHGGAQQATALARQLGHEPRLVHGRRVTSDVDLTTIQSALRGELNSRLVAQASQHGVRAVGLCGADGGLLHVSKRPPWTIDGESVDFGWVGEIEAVQTDVLTSLFGSGFVPIIAPLGVDAQGQLYNVNADTVAGALAKALGAAEFLLVTEAGGVLQQVVDPDSVMAQCDEATFESGKADGWIQGGMRVKLHVAFEALRSGIAQVFILAPDDLTARQRATQVVF